VRRVSAGCDGPARRQTALEAELDRKLLQTHDEFLPAEAYIEKWGYSVNENGTVPYAG